MTTISLRHAQARLLETVEQAKTSPVLLEDSGQPVAIVLSIAEFRRLSEADVRERGRQPKGEHDRVFGAFDRGEFRELTEADWRDLADGRRRYSHDPESWALPSKAQAG